MSPKQINKLDASDKLSGKRALFSVPEDVIYLNGNSLGPLPSNVQHRLNSVISEEWGKDLIGSWNKHGWIDLPLRVGEKIAPILGAASGQVLCCDSVSLNLFKLLASCLQLRPDRTRILSQKDNFPTDLYVAQGLQQLLGPSSCQLDIVAAEQLADALSEEIAVLMLSHVNFRDGAVHDIAALTQMAHERDILVIWDLAHSAGILPLSLDDWNVDFAVGCGYKFLNGGPGAPSFVYVNKKHHDQFTQPLQGWMGHKAPFEFDPSFTPAEGVGQFMTGTPPILSLAALDAALDVFADVDVKQLNEKSMALAEYFLKLAEQQPALRDLQLSSPKEPVQRGGHLSFAHPEAYAICQAWGDVGIIADFRSPDLLRVSFSPLILCFEEIDRSVQALFEVMHHKTFSEAKFHQRRKVT